MNEGTCCVSCSCDLDICIQYGTCCPDLLEYLPSVKESISKIKITCDYASLKKNHVPVGTPRGIHLWMYRKCSDNFYTKPYIKERCENPDMFEEIQAKIPVSDISTDYTYQTIYCATCNAVLNENIVYWGASIECKNRKMFPSSTNTVLEEVNAIRSCNIIYKLPPNGMLMPNCTPKINECNVTGLWKQYDPLVEAACHAYTAIYDSK